LKEKFKFLIGKLWWKFCAVEYEQNLYILLLFNIEQYVLI
jgi:hypothetical protein